MALPKSRNLRLSKLSSAAVVVVDDMSRKTYASALENLRFSLPWLDVSKTSGAIQGALHSQSQRYALVGRHGIYLVGDGPFMESGAADGKTSFEPAMLRNFSWSSE